MPVPTCPVRPSRIARALHAALANDAEVAGLLALMLLTDAPPPRPYRTAWRTRATRRAGPDSMGQGAHRQGIALLSAVLPRRAIGEYQLQAAIAAIHDEAATADQTDWPQILVLYGLLERMTGRSHDDSGLGARMAGQVAHSIVSRNFSTETTTWPSTSMESESGPGTYMPWSAPSTVNTCRDSRLASVLSQAGSAVPPPAEMARSSSLVQPPPTERSATA
jgi:hypothetical protein